MPKLMQQAVKNSATMDAKRRYEIRVLERDGTFFLRVPELGLLTESASLQAGYAAAVAQVADTLDRYRRAGFDDELPPPATGPALPSSFGREMWPFLAKTTVVSAVLASFMLWAASPLANALHRLEVSARLGAESARATFAELASPDRVGRAVIDGTQRVAQALEAVTPDRKEELHRSLKIIVRDLHPFAVDLAPLFDPAGGGADGNGSPPTDQRARSVE